MTKFMEFALRLLENTIFPSGMMVSGKKDKSLVVAQSNKSLAEAR